MKHRVVAVLVGVLLVGSFSFGAQPTDQSDVVRIQEMPEYIASHSYIFVFDDKIESKMPIAQQAKELARAYKGEVRHSYSRVIRGFSAMMSAEAGEKQRSIGSMISPALAASAVVPSSQ